jgi:hypothetical protein
MEEGEDALDLAALATAFRASNEVRLNDRGTHHTHTRTHPHTNPPPVPSPVRPPDPTPP